MIIGKDKERVRLMEIDLKLARELIEKVRDDMEMIAKDLAKKDPAILANDPYWVLYHDIGRCSGWLSESKRHKG